MSDAPQHPILPYETPGPPARRSAVPAIMGFATSLSFTGLALPLIRGGPLDEPLMYVAVVVVAAAILTAILAVTMSLRLEGTRTVRTHATLLASVGGAAFWGLDLLVAALRIHVGPAPVLAYALCYPVVLALMLVTKR